MFVESRFPRTEDVLTDVVVHTVGLYGEETLLSSESRKRYQVCFTQHTLCHIRVVANDSEVQEKDAHERRKSSHVESAVEVKVDILHNDRPANHPPYHRTSEVSRQ